ncbi:unnamed protein product [Arctia plantaginis]|uniref:Uncharacterized protein n=1 Tax=Arctia plantaginis TaxID=874455 RepID=A0A8S1BJZ8_ARCPL|nr:unnamed protein product [Arctia plantaginis]
MDEICRLCCSTTFVNNDIFDEENALYLKMSLYLPIKVFKNDQLPQKICDKCSCKVNDFYQFCNETIEVQARLRAILRSSGPCHDETIDLSLVKNSTSPPPNMHIEKLCERSTQTDTKEESSKNDDKPVQIKEEPIPNIPSPVKQEEDNFDDDLDSDNLDHRSSDSEDISLKSLKIKANKKSTVNAEVSQKRGRKKKSDLQGWEALMDALPGAALSVVDRNNVPDLQVQVVKEEMEDHPTNAEGLLLEMNIFHCCICMVKCYSRSEMLQHYKQHASESVASDPPAAPAPPEHEPLRCTRCRKIVSHGEWAGHWQRHWERDRRPYRCALCEKTFRDAHQILKHGITHNHGEGAATEPVDKRFVCDLCPEGFVYMRYLLSHRTRAHPEAAGRALTLRCGQCARHFAHINSLRRHLRAHSGERNFLCNVCGKALSSREHLKFHIRIHTGYKPNVCKTCGKGFVKKCNLTLHERVHSGEKPHVCSHCGKAFSQRSTLVIHERYHSGARPYVCSLCGRGFVAKGLLSMHLKTTCI